MQILNNTITGNSNGIQLKAGRNIKLSGNALDNIGENFTAAPGVTYTDLTVGLEYSTTASTNGDVVATLVSESQLPSLITADLQLTNLRERFIYLRI